MGCVFAKVLWSGNTNKEFWLSSGGRETAAVKIIMIKTCNFVA
jgi:hypothetical protein